MVLRAIHLGCHTLARDSPEPVRARDVDVPLAGAGHDAPGDGVLGLGLYARGDPKRVLLRRALGYGQVDHPELAQRQRTRLVEDDHVQVSRLLEPAPVPDQQAVLGAHGRGDRDHQGDGQAQGVGARDDQDRDHPDDGEVDGRADELPDHQRDERRGDGHARQHLGRAVGQVLRPGLRLLGVRYQPHDPRQLGLRPSP
jgi:hypothetical protein